MTWKVPASSDCVADSLPFSHPTAMALKSQHKSVVAVSTVVRPKEKVVFYFKLNYRIQDTTLFLPFIQGLSFRVLQSRGISWCHSFPFDVKFQVRSVTSFPKTIVSGLQIDKFYVNKGEASRVCFFELD